MKTERISWEEAVELLRSKPSNRKLVEDCFFDDPLQSAAHRYLMSTEWCAIRALAGPPRGTALDVGAGRGIASYAMAQDGWLTTALEPDPSPIVGAAAIRALSKAAGLKISIVETWGERLPFRAGTFDLVLCRQVLHHARDLPRLCEELGRVLKPGGLMIAAREHVVSRREDLPAFLDSHPLHRYYGGENAYLLSEYKKCIRDAGMSLVKLYNPLASEINTYPLAFPDVKRRIAKKLRFPFPEMIPDWVLALRGRMLRTPGRLYSFVARKN